MNSFACFLRGRIKLVPLLFITVITRGYAQQSGSLSGSHNPGNGCPFDKVDWTYDYRIDYLEDQGKIKLTYNNLRCSHNDARFIYQGNSYSPQDLGLASWPASNLQYAGKPIMYVDYELYYDYTFVRTTTRNQVADGQFWNIGQFGLFDGEVVLKVGDRRITKAEFNPSKYKIRIIRSYEGCNSGSYATDQLSQLAVKKNNPQTGNGQSSNVTINGSSSGTNSSPGSQNNSSSSQSFPAAGGTGQSMPITTTPSTDKFTNTVNNLTTILNIAAPYITSQSAELQQKELERATRAAEWRARNEKNTARAVLFEENCRLSQKEYSKWQNFCELVYMNKLERVLQSETKPWSVIARSPSPGKPLFGISARDMVADPVFRKTITTDAERLKRLEPGNTREGKASRLFWGASAKMYSSTSRDYFDNNLLLNIFGEFKSVPAFFAFNQKGEAYQVTFLLFGENANYDEQITVTKFEEWKSFIISQFGADYVQSYENEYIFKDKVITFTCNQLILTDLNYAKDNFIIDWPDEFKRVDELSGGKYRFVTTGINFLFYINCAPLKYEKECTTTTAQFARTNGKGAIIESVIPGSIAAKSGLKSGDIITKIRGYDVTGPYIVQWVTNLYAFEGKMPLTFLRDGQEQQTELLLEFSGQQRKSGEDHLAELIRFSDSLAQALGYVPMQKEDVFKSTHTFGKSNGKYVSPYYSPVGPKTSYFFKPKTSAGIVIYTIDKDRNVIELRHSEKDDAKSRAQFSRIDAVVKAAMESLNGILEYNYITNCIKTNSEKTKYVIEVPESVSNRGVIKYAIVVRMAVYNNKAMLSVDFISAPDDIKDEKISEL
jgi:membrane-associated protease RseP (regulator of RpoE activity)